MSKSTLLIVFAAVLVGIAILSVGNKYFNKPAVPGAGTAYQNPALARGEGQQCQQIVLAAGGIAAASGNPYAMAAGAGAILAPDKVCEGGNAVWNGVKWVGGLFS